MVKKTGKGKAAEKSNMGHLHKPVKSNAGGGIEAVHAIAFWGLAALLFIAPFYRGLFFPENQQKAIFFAAIIFLLVWCWKWILRDFSFLSHPLDYFMLAVPIVYTLSAFRAANYGLAIDAILAVILYFIIYWCVIQLIKEPKDLDRLLIVAYVSGIGVVLAGLMTATGVIYIKDGFKDERLYSTLQYPNTLAIFSLLIFSIGAYFWFRHLFVHNSVEKEKTLMAAGLLRYLFAAGNYLLIASLIGSRSTGGYLMFVLFSLMVFLFIPNQNRLQFLFHLIMVTLPAAGGMFMFFDNVSKGNLFKASAFIAAGAFIVVLLQKIYQLMMCLYNRPRWTRLCKAAAIFAVAVFLLLGFVGLFKEKDKITTMLGGRLNEYNLAQSAVHRINFYEDAINMVKERPVLGWGGGGWKEAYQYFQSYSYSSTLVHSNYLQTAVEAGIIGLMALIGLWGGVIAFAKRAYRNSKVNETKLQTVFITLGAMIVGIHALVDFDLSFGCVAILIYTFIGIIRNMTYPTGITVKKNPGTKEKIVFAVSIALGLVIIGYTSFLIVAFGYSKAAWISYAKGDFKEALRCIEKAVEYNPSNTEYRDMLARLYAGGGKPDLALEQWAIANKIGKYNANRYSGMVWVAFQKGDSDEAAVYAEESIRKAPWDIRYYENAATFYKEAGIAELKKKNRQIAEKYFEEVLRMPDRIKHKRDELSYSPVKYDYSADIMVTPKTMLAVGAVQCIKGKTDEAIKNLQIAANDDKIKGEAYFWLSIAAERSNNRDNALKFTNELKNIMPGLEKKYKEIRNILE